MMAIFLPRAGMALSDMVRGGKVSGLSAEIVPAWAVKAMRAG